MIMMAETIVALLLSSLLGDRIIKLVSKEIRPHLFDFVITDSDGRKVAIEVKGAASIDSAAIKRFVQAAASEKDEVERFILVTPDRPPDTMKRFFDSALESFKIHGEWLALRDLPRNLGLGDDIDLNDPEVLRRLQLSVITGPAAFDAHTGNTDESGKAGATIDGVLELDNETEKLALMLSRQFSPTVVRHLVKAKSIQEELKLGEPRREVYVLISDIVNYSTITRFADGDILQDIMTSYYRKSRDAVWDNKGMLDKFIGDSVVAIWGYPPSEQHTALDVVKCAARLVKVGRALISDFETSHDERIESGTRIGIARGELRSLNIGLNQIEISFVGNAINLASRLEHCCDVDGALISNMVHRDLARHSPEMNGALNVKSRLLDPGEAKGQMTPIQAWQIEAPNLEAIFRND